VSLLLCVLCAEWERIGIAFNERLDDCQSIHQLFEREQESSVMLPSLAGAALAAITSVKVWAEQTRFRPRFAPPLIEQLTGDRPLAKHTNPAALPVVGDLVDAAADLLRLPLTQGNHALQAFKDETLPMLNTAVVTLDG
jgi:hypothetical protein